MTLLIYIIGVIATFGIFVLYFYLDDEFEKVTIGGLVGFIALSLLSWVAVFASIVTFFAFGINWNKEIWRKKK